MVVKYVVCAFVASVAYTFMRYLNMLVHLDELVGVTAGRRIGFHWPMFA